MALNENYTNFVYIDFGEISKNGWIWSGYRSRFYHLTDVHVKWDWIFISKVNLELELLWTDSIIFDWIRNEIFKWIEFIYRYRKIAYREIHINKHIKCTLISQIKLKLRFNFSINYSSIDIFKRLILTNSLNHDF